MLHRKSHIENHLRSAENRLAARLELLTTNGMDADRMKKDPQIRRFQAQARKARRELSAIAATETLMAEKAESRIRKAAAKSEASHNKPRKRDRDAPPAKKRKKRHLEADENEQ